MEYGGNCYAGGPYAGSPVNSEDFSISIFLNLIFPVSFVFYGEIGDIIFLPPDLDLEPINMNDRLSPCLLYDNEEM